MSRAPHRRLLPVLAVGLGGALGTGARQGISAALPVLSGWPVATLAVNLLGAFLLGMLLEVLLLRGEETRRGLLLRLGAGTGFLGGFTTFSSLALEVQRMLAAGAPGQALAYLGISLAGGFTACLAGVLVAARGRPA